MDHIGAAGIAEWVRINGGEWVNVEFTCDGNRLGYREPGSGPPTWISVQQITNVDALGDMDLAVVDIEARIADGRLIGAHIRKATLDSLIGALTAPRVPVFPAASAPSPRAPSKPAQPSGPGPVVERVPSRPARRRATWIAVAVVVLLLGGLGAFLVLGSNDNSSTDTSSAEASDDASPIEAAAQSCGVEANVGDNGSSIEFDTTGEEDYSGDGFEDVACVLKALDAPDRVVSRMDSTRALDGTQDAAWEDYESFWNYHPDSGMNLTIYVPD